MEDVDDSKYLEPPDDARERYWCEEHHCRKPCEACRYEERD